MTDDGVKNDVTEEQLGKLYRLNLYAALFHLVTGVVIFPITDRDAVVPQWTFFPDPDTRDGDQEWLPSPEKQYDVKVGYLSGIFLLLASLDHFLVVFFRSKYEYYLVRSQNHFRWAEYSISASVMHMEIAMLSGVFDVHLMFCIFGLTACTMFFGSIQEFVNRDLHGSPEKKYMFPFWLGFIPHMFNWSVIACYFFYSVSNGDPPAFVWAIIFILFFLDISFAVNLYLQQKEIGKWKSYYHGELGFIVLSFTAKQLLAWINFGGTQALNQ